MSPPNLNNHALTQLQSQPHGYSLFAALRLLEQSFADRPRLGEARKAADDPVRLGQAPHLSFAPCDVAQLISNEDEPVRLEQFSFGVFGPNGALPLHLTELAYERRRHKDDATIVDFINLFQHRLTALFYRAWAESEPAVSLDRPDSDRFRTYVGALIGMAPDSARDADSAPDYAKLSRAGLFAAQPRSAEGLEAVLADYFGIDVEVRQFVGSWMEIPDDLRCRLGGLEEAALGSNATLGVATWQCQHKFEIVLGPLPHTAFANFLPGAAGLAELHSLVRLYTNDEWEWQVRLLLRDVEIPGARLDGTNPLGWTSWLGERRAHAADVVIQEAAATRP
ncbi:type VI secretion system baseplate subunit TssG [Steroidobacter sp.]|uniref:type VI secretion system baseplate subunit TssG n=1 Tax=Steroidobacter sp. TaxID=1978227 RepID=UPI001A36ACAD|nr:type VI secretion system baseplate subunit TssG [Steroidobacter sp.]MBL8266489.1 type VI secretion system baseplate subunit TssG [Steroidobacter sp.]